MENRFKFFSYNWIKQDATDLIIEDLKENPYFPLSNIKHDFSTKVFRTLDGISTVQFIVDIKATAPIDACLVKGSNIDGFGVTSILLEGSGTLDFATPAVSVNLELNHENNLGHAFFTESDCRYWRFTLSNSGNYVELANVFLGRGIYLQNNNIDYGWKYQNEDNSKIERNRYGQAFIDKANNIKSLQLKFNLLTKDELKILNEVFERHGKFEPVWIILDPDETIYEDMELFAGQFYFKERPEYLNSGFSLYNVDFSLNEVI